MIQTAHDPFFKDKELLVILPDREELSNGGGSLTPEVVEWMRTNTPNAKFTYRRATGPLGDDKLMLVFVFEEENHMVYFKMRWQ